LAALVIIAPCKGASPKVAARPGSSSAIRSLPAAELTVD
jgi:hypothetical protein